MKPTIEDYQKSNSSTTWRGTYKHITYELQHHSISKYNPQGVWCYYIIIDSKEYPEILDHNFDAIFNVPMFKNVDFHGGITFCKKTKIKVNEGSYPETAFVERDQLKVGCDYNHLYDSDIGFVNSSYDSVLFDCKRSIDQFLEIYPKKYFRSSWSGKYYHIDDIKFHNDIVYGKDELDKVPDGWKV